MKIFKSFLIILILTTTAVNAVISPKVDWVEGKIKAFGESVIAVDESGQPFDIETERPLSISDSRIIAEQRAREKALHEAINIISELQVDSQYKMKDLVRNDPVVRENITRVIDEYSKYRDRPSGYLKSSCELEINYGYLLTAINYSFPADSFPLRDDIEISTNYTSVIIDVRGLGIKPMLLPSVLNENGLEVYSKNFVIPSEAVRFNIVSYTRSEKDALKHKKAGKHPFFCAALKNLNGNPVISDNDIKKIFSSKKNIEYLRKCRVIFIIER